MKKHKIFLYPLEENGKVKVFLFQSGDIGANRGSSNAFDFPIIAHEPFAVYSCGSGEMAGNRIYVNGNVKHLDFKISSSRNYTKEEFDKLKELEYAYNNR